MFPVVECRKRLMLSDVDNGVQRFQCMLSSRKTTQQKLRKASHKACNPLIHPMKWALQFIVASDPRPMDLCACMRISN
jgi:hypothetical protein